MTTLPFYIVDVFASSRYEGNQLAVFVDLADELADDRMQAIAREINFAETTFVKADNGGGRFVVKIFTPEHEVPFAGHPSIGTSYVIAKFLLPDVPVRLVLELAHSQIDITILQPNAIDDSVLFMRQAQPEFREQLPHAVVADELGISLDQLDESWPVQEISTGLPYIIIPLKNLAAMNELTLDYTSFRGFLEKRNKYRTNSSTGHSTSLFFFTTETYEPASSFNTRMRLIENEVVSEDAATGSANGCFLAYLLRYQRNLRPGDVINATVEQGFQINRKSYVYINGRFQHDRYELNVGGHTKLVAAGSWFI
ncbi:PhzF family phenazine biosynthesis protein [Fibrella sp. HMF5335]|uniref:PhzF family phenazine biosynthesis protein n=1 Tax=Fibrella rubiginis TaxID=2817060 RepID=A0A939GHK8_9BACT|nr:PhzF family phenazine biosynthesis protein [Fibrella rubiginis]MBO0939184.1 PhzF family phenazine biosynthesis protein [Fibrella rubiginis]